MSDTYGDDTRSASGDPGAVQVVLADTVTKLLDAHRGHVIVAGSHGGVYAGWCAAKGGARAVILNDAGVGLDGAGISSLAFLDEIGLAAATADSKTCRISDASDMLACGVVSHVNQAAAALGCVPGQTVRECADRMRSAAMPSGQVATLQESRFVISRDSGQRVVIGIDSAALFQPDDAGRVVVTASHGALVGGKPDKVVPAGVFAAFFHDAGGAKGGSGYSRLPSLDALGVVGGTVAAASARIGDARSCYRDGVLSHVNETARARGGRVDMPLCAFIGQLAREPQEENGFGRAR